MAGETKAAALGAVAAIICAAISGYFTVRASRSSDDAKSSSSQVAATAVDEGYSTTVKPFFDQTKDLTDALQTRMDLMQSELRALRAAIAAGPHAAAAPVLPPPAAAAAAPKKLEVPAVVRFRSESLIRFQKAPAP